MILLGNEDQVEARFGMFGDSVNLYAIEVHGLHRTTTGTKIILDESDGNLGDVGHVEVRHCPFGDSVSVSARSVHGLRQTYHSLRNHFGCTRWYS
jgi:hypothetical protein